MEIITGIANLRNMSEIEVMNTFTWRQIFHIGMTYLKDRLMVVKIISDALSDIKVDEDDDTLTGSDAIDRASDLAASKIRSRSKLPKWFKPSSGKYNIIDLDGPLPQLKASIVDAFNMGAKRTGKV